MKFKTLIPRKFRTLFETKLHFSACNFFRNWMLSPGQNDPESIENELQITFGLEIMQIHAQIWPVFCFSDPFYDPLSLQFTGTINHTSNGEQVSPGHRFIIMVLGLLALNLYLLNFAKYNEGVACNYNRLCSCRMQPYISLTVALFNLIAYQCVGGSRIIQQQLNMYISSLVERFDL